MFCSSCSATVDILIIPETSSFERLSFAFSDEFDLQNFWIRDVWYTTSWMIFQPSPRIFLYFLALLSCLQNIVEKFKSSDFELTSI